MGEGPKKFGRYFLLDLMAQGGMAEIYRARLAAPEGAGRLMVIKRIQASFGNNAEFLQMFKSEIKVTMGFNHPNIVQLYDFGEEGGQPYIAMELVDGKNLRQLMTRFSELKQKFPIELAAHVVEQAACGLHYAHSFKDKISGQPLNIVHRDISPQNLIIAYEGNVKVIDFGIAKAATNSEATRAGVIKGKPSYLSPEQINGDVLDGRSDIFSLGTVLWELLAGRKLFYGDNDLAVLKLIEACQTHVKPPSTLNPDVPPELDYITLRALAKHRDKRYQTAEEFQRALHKFIYSYASEFNPSDLSYYAKDLFKKEIIEDRKKIQKLNDEVEKLLAGGSIRTYGGSDTDVGTEDKTATSDGSVPSLDKSDSTIALPKVDQKRAIGKEHSDTYEPGALMGTRLEIDEKQRGMGRTAPLPSGGSFRPVGGPSSSNPFRRTLSQPSIRTNEKKFPTKLVAAAAALVGIAILGPQFGIEIPFFSESKQPQRTTASINPTDTTGNGQTADTTPPAPAPAQLMLRFNLIPGGGQPQVSLNGRALSADNPMARVSLDAPLDLTVNRAGYKPFHRQFYLDSKQFGGLREWMMDITLEPTRFGMLSLTSTPSAEATIYLDGKPWVQKTPIENEKIPVGTYNVRLRNDLLGMEKTITISIQEGKITSRDERLEIKD